MYIMGLGNAPLGECMYTGSHKGTGTLHTQYYKGAGGVILNVSTDGSGIAGGSLEDRIAKLEDRQMRIMNLLSKIATALGDIGAWEDADHSGRSHPGSIDAYTGDGDIGAIKAEIAASQAGKKVKLLW